MTSKKGVKVNAGIYIVDMAGHSAAQIKAYKGTCSVYSVTESCRSRQDRDLLLQRWYPRTLQVSLLPDRIEFTDQLMIRDDVKNFDPACACGPGGTLNSANECVGGSGDTKMDDWNEFWLDIHSARCKENVHDAMIKRIQAAKSKGCDGMDPDNVDSVCALALGAYSNCLTF